MWCPMWDSPRSSGSCTCTTAAHPHLLSITHPSSKNNSRARQWIAHRAHWGYREGTSGQLGHWFELFDRTGGANRVWKIPSGIEKFVTESVKKGCHKWLLRLIARHRPKVQVPAAHFNLNLHSFVLDSSSSMIWLWEWAATTGHCVLICLTKVILCSKGQVTDTNRRLQDAGREVRYARAFVNAFAVRKDGTILWMEQTLINYDCSVLFDLPLCKVTAQTEEVIRCRIQQRNMAITVEKLQLCIPGTTHAPLLIHFTTSHFIAIWQA